MRPGPLAALALVAGCFQPGSHECAGGWVCPEKYACATPPSYCGLPDEVAKCESKPDWTGCAYADAGGGVCRGSVCSACTTDREGCATNGWVAMTAGGAVTALWTALGQGIAVGGPPSFIVEYNGLSWSDPVPLPAVTGDLTGVWGTGDGRAFAVTSGGEVLARDASGTWTQVFTAPSGLHAIWGADATHVFAVGDAGTVAHFDGASWTVETVTPAAPLFAVWGTSDGGDVFAVGNCGAVFRRQATWTTSRAPSCGTLANLAGVWGSDASHVYAVGGATDADVEYFDGSAWTNEPVPTTSITLTNLSGVWGRSASDVIAIDHTGHLLLLPSPDPATWTAPKIETADFQAITGTLPIAGQFNGDVFIGARDGTIYRNAP